MIADDENIYFLNNGIYDPNIYYQYYLDQSENFNIELNVDPDIEFGGLIRINIPYSEGFNVLNAWNLQNGILDGQNGIYANESYSGHLPYITLNQLLFDNNGNLLVLNPYCEYYHHPLAIREQSTGYWYHVLDEEDVDLPTNT